MSSTRDQREAFESFQSLSSVDQFNQDKQLLRDTLLEEDKTDLIQQAMRLSEIYEDDEDNEDDMNISFPLRKRKISILTVTAVLCQKKTSLMSLHHPTEKENRVGEEVIIISSQAVPNLNTFQAAPA